MCGARAPCQGPAAAKRHIAGAPLTETTGDVVMNRIAIVSLSALLLLSACGSSTGDRALSGGAIGAAGGAIVGAFAGTPATGALIGGAAGAAAGALTSPNQVNLGKPAWE